MNSKQLFLTTALLTSLSSAAIAEVSISGEAKVNVKGGDYTMETDLTITGKSGDTSVVAQLGLDNNNEVEQLYMTSKVAGIDIKAGRWRSGKSELRVGTVGNYRVRASTSIGGINLTYQDRTGADGTWVAIAGTIGGVKVMHKVKDTSTETKASGSMGGIDVAYHFKDYDTGDIDDSYTIKTSVQGIDLTYVNTTSDAGISMDGFFGKHSSWYPGVTEATGIGISTLIAGNQITFKMMDMIVDGVDDNKDKLILTRKLSSGATFEATYVDSKSNENSLDLELAVKF